jgi:hypothetical protein
MFWNACLQYRSSKLNSNHSSIQKENVLSDHSEGLLELNQINRSKELPGNLKYREIKIYKSNNSQETRW